jgi:hypothetical protein
VAACRRRDAVRLAALSASQGRRPVQLAIAPQSRDEVGRGFEVGAAERRSSFSHHVVECRGFVGRAHSAEPQRFGDGSVEVGQRSLAGRVEEARVKLPLTDGQRRERRGGARIGRVEQARALPVRDRCVATPCEARDVCGDEA